MAFWVSLFMLFALSSVGLGACVFRRTAAWPAVDRVAGFCLPGALVALVLLLAGCLSWMLSYFYNYPRLAPSVALCHGYDLYYGPDDGPILNTIYAPMTALVYLPSGLGRDPTTAMALAFAVNLLLFLAPIGCFLTHRWTGDRRLNLRLVWALVFFVTASVCYEPSRCLLELAHAEPPALASGALACFFVYRMRGQSDWTSLILSSLFAVMAVWSKQVEVPILAALPLFVWATFGRRCLLRQLICLFATGLAVSAVLLLTFGPKETFFNIWTIPGSHPISAHGIGWIAIGWQLTMAMLPMLCVIVFVAFTTAQAQAQTPWSLRAWLNENRWTVLLFVAVCMIPMSILGRARVGGDDNAFHSVYYLILAATVLLAESALRRPAERTSETAVLIMMLAALLHFVLAGPTVREVERLRHARANVEQVAFEYAERHPGKAYFPRCPLAGLLAEKRLYHFNGGVYDRTLAGFRPSDRHFRAHLPPQMQYVALTPDMTEGDPFMMAFLPEFSRSVELDELPGWIVYATEAE